MCIFAKVMKWLLYTRVHRNHVKQTTNNNINSTLVVKEKHKEKNYILFFLSEQCENTIVFVRMYAGVVIKVNLKWRIWYIV